MPSTNSWPSRIEYNTAVQNPHARFADPKLQNGHASTDNNRIPIGASGNFAVVFKMQCGPDNYAVRCFTRPVTNQQNRYAALSQHLEGLSLPSLVDFSYLDQGIRVGSQWYPVLQMGWITGKPLHRYVESKLGEPSALKNLAREWRGVVVGLVGAHMAHGDLQHGNILVDAHDKLRLVDYDGFYLPSLSNQPPGEVGHVNYQHPERIRQGYYAENGDAFPALVIYLSLLALQSDSKLWQTFHNGENLLFSAKDFELPEKTVVWQALLASANVQVRLLTQALATYCRGPVAGVPPLEDVLARSVHPPASPLPVAPLPRVVPPSRVAPLPPVALPSQVTPLPPVVPAKKHNARWVWPVVLLLSGLTFLYIFMRDTPALPAKFAELKILLATLGNPPPSQPDTRTQEAVPSGTPYAIVDSGLVNLRTAPDIAASVVARLGPDTPLIVTSRDDQNEWLQVCCINEQLVWVLLDQVKVEGDISTLPTTALSATPTEGVSDATAILTQEPLFVLASNGLMDLREAPGRESPVIARLGRDAPLTLIGRDASTMWLQVCCVNEKPIWVEAEQVEISGDPNTLPALVLTPVSP